MQAVESQNLIIYHADLSGQWPEEGAHAFAMRLPYLKRLALGSGGDAARASLAGIALAVRALAALLGRRVAAGEIVFANGEKPRLPQAARLAAVGGSARVGPVAQPDFSVSHSGFRVGCAALADGRVGLDIEAGSGPRIAGWVAREALLKATGDGLRALSELRDIELPESTVRETCVDWRGERWYLRRLDFLPQTSACVLTSYPVRAVAAHSVPLAELFAL